MERLLLVGGGMLYENLSQILGERFDLHCIDQEDCDLLAIVSGVQCAEPRWIIHCGPLAESAWQEASAQVDWTGEAATIARLASLADDRQSRFLLLASDSVFAGPRMFHEEDSPVNNVDPTVTLKLAVEQAALLGSANAAVVRTHAFGWSRRENTFAERAYDCLSRGEPIAVDTHAHATPILATDLAAFLQRALRTRLQGICHCTGAERANALRFALELAAIAGFDARLVQLAGISPDRATDIAPASPCQETSLNCRHARRVLETPMPLLREGLERFVEQVENGYRRRLQSRLALAEHVAA